MSNSRFNIRRGFVDNSQARLRNFSNRGRGGRQNRGISHGFDSEAGSSDGNANSDRPPPYLRGRDIGMWFAARNAARNANLTPEERAARGMRLPKPILPLATILLSERKKQYILQLLASTSTEDFTEDITCSNFKMTFKKSIQGLIEDKLTSRKILERNSSLDEELQKELLDKQINNKNYIQMKSYREKLPAYSKRHDIANLVRDNQVIVISGETGCGKTTQVTQFILDSYVEEGAGSVCKIVCSQPRRISAISIAERVSEERGENLGQSCGYQIRLESSLPRSRGSILYCTTGVILRQLASDPLMSNVSHLILDEIHERDINSDFLIALMRKVLPQRPDMKLILMSATLNSEQFSKYYGDCPMINIPGFTHPVQEFYLEDVLELTGFQFDEVSWNMRRSTKQEKEFVEVIDPHIRALEAENKYSKVVCWQLRHPSSEFLNLDLILKLLKHICNTATNNGAILVFLTGYLEISNFIQLMESGTYFSPSKYLIIPLHSQMPSVEQKSIFKPTAANIRKIIVSTNIAETSITIDDVVYVVDCGYIKETGYNAATNSKTLGARFVSLANAKQRRGRAGRVQPGVCYHLFSKARETMLEKYQLPEILRTRLENVVLHVKALQLGKADAFLETLIDVPDKKSIAKAIELLTRIEALDETENLTPLGYHLSKLPMSPQMGKMILFGVIFSCLDPILSICATLDFKDAFQLPLGREKESDEKKYELSKGIKSDHILNHIVLAEYEAASNQYAFCRQYFLSQQIIKMLLRMKKQFMGILYEMKFVPNENSKDEMCNLNSHNLSLIKAIVCAGLYPNIATFRCRKGKFVRISDGEQGSNLKLHLKSILFKERSADAPLLAYHTRIKSTSDFLHDGTLVYPLPVIFFGDRYHHVLPTEANDTHKIGIGTKMLFNCSESTADIIKQLRERLNAYLKRAIDEPTAEPFFKRAETDVISAIIELITNEDIQEFDPEAFDED